MRFILFFNREAPPASLFWQRARINGAPVRKCGIKSRPFTLRLAIVLPLLKGVFYKLVLMEILYLGLTWPLLQFSLASCCISKTHIARYARL